MLEFLFDLPLLVTGPAIIGSLYLFAIGGLVVVRRQVLPRLRIQVADSEFAGAMLQSVMVFYGLAVALMGVVSLYFQDWYNSFFRIQPMALFGIYPIGDNHNLIAEFLVIITFFVLSLKFWLKRKIKIIIIIKIYVTEYWKNQPDNRTSG